MVPLGGRAMGIFQLVVFTALKELVLIVITFFSLSVKFDAMVTSSSLLVAMIVIYDCSVPRLYVD